MEETGKYTYQYPHPSVTVDCVIFGFDGKSIRILLIERGVEPFKGSWALPGGFVRIDETVEDAAKRELWEETNVRGVYMSQLAVFSEVERDPRERVISVAFYALVKPSDHDVIGGDDAASAAWFSLEDYPELAFDHEEIVKAAFSQLQRNFRAGNAGLELFEDKFSMSQLYTLHTLVTKSEIDRRNFYKKMTSSKWVEFTDLKEPDTPHKPSRLFSIDRNLYDQEIKASFNLLRIEIEEELMKNQKPEEPKKKK
jgi:8-oxo-dGTP diphosphatase